MAYKDEYEVARLLIGPEARVAAAAIGGRRPKVTWRLHPPLLRTLGKKGKLEVPARVARPAMRLLAASERVRGTRLDPFGHTELRKGERSLVGEYQAAIEGLLAGLDADDLQRAVEIAELPMAVRGYEDIKLRAIDEMRARLRDLAG
ncbi:MAG: hypothetical protein P8N02_00300 [Actinomycetota bacterium]|jgi:indolepyruvate ferredoxin oxidoreductase|nr:hypothetical protein [Actinomycetota bacterium]